MATRQQREFQTDQRRKQVAELYLQGWSQPAIAGHLNVTQPTVCADLKAIRQLWRKSAIRDFDEIRATELQKLDLIEKESWAAWHRSQKPAQSAIVTGEGADQRARKSLKYQNGDPRYLQQVNHCIAHRRALLGLDAIPAPPRPEGAFNVHVSLEVRRERVHTLLAAFGERDRFSAAGAGPAGRQSGDVRSGDERGSVEDGAPRRLPGPDAAERD